MRIIVDGQNTASFTCGIQEAIDSLPAAGGIVYVPAGTYVLRRSILLRSGVSLEGEGLHTVLTRPPMWRETPFATVQPNELFVRMRVPADLKLGEQIYMQTWQQKGWWARHGYVRKISTDRVDVELLNSDPDRTYLLEENLFISNLFPAVYALNATQISVRHLTIDGQQLKHIGEKVDFVVAGIHTKGCQDVRVEGVTVRNWPGDGISIQEGAWARVSGCLVDNCWGQGLHPGTGIMYSIWENNISRNNTVDGYFFCHNVRYTLAVGNLLVGNRRHGIGGLGDPDSFNTVLGNICRENGKHGIEGESAFSNIIANNICSGNSVSKPGEFAGIYLKNHRDNVVSNNVFGDINKNSTQSIGLLEVEPSGPNKIERQ